VSPDFAQALRIVSAHLIAALTLGGGAVSARNTDILSCRPPSLEAYIAPVFREAPTEEGNPSVPSLDVLFDANGAITGAQNLADKALFESLKRSLELMRFEPAMCFDKPVPGFAEVDFPGYFVVTDGPVDDPDYEPPFCRLRFTGPARAQLESFGSVLRLDWLEVRVVIDETGRILNVRGGPGELAEAVEKLISVAEHPFLPATLKGEAVASEVTFLWRAHKHEKHSPEEEAFPAEPQIPLPPWPETLALEKDAVVGITVFPGEDGSIWGAYPHPDVPEALVTPLLNATRKWRWNEVGMAHGVDVKIALLPESREITVADIIEVTHQRPKPIRQGEPKYPRHLKQAGISGTVRIEFMIDAKGRVPRDYIKVLAASDSAFIEPTIDAIEKWRFEPGRINDQPVAVMARITIPFDVLRP